MDVATQEGFIKVITEMRLKHRHILRESYSFKTNRQSLSLFELADVSIDEIRKAEIDYNGFYRRETFGFSEYNKRLLFEDISEDDIRNIRHRLQREYDISDWQISMEPFANDIIGVNTTNNTDRPENNNSLRLLIPVIEKNREIIINVMRQEGYYLINEIPLTTSGNVMWTSLSFAPYVQKDVRDVFRESKWFFHVTSDMNVAQILSHGLEPKSSDGIFKYMPRVYMWNENFIGRATRYASNMYSYAFDKMMFDACNGYTVIKIDAQAVIRKSAVYYDPLINDAFFVTDTIEPKWLESFRHLTISANGKAEYKVTKKRQLLEEIAMENNIEYSSIGCLLGGRVERDVLEKVKTVLSDNDISYSDKIYSEDDMNYFIALE